MDTKDILTIMLRSGSGKAGVALLLGIVIISVTVVFLFPMDFGSKRWNNPAAWADNPKSVPPFWVGLFMGNNSIAHKVFEVSPQETQANLVQNYSFHYEYNSGKSPTFTTLSFTDVTFHNRPPLLELNVVRPDGREIVLYQQVLRGARPGESSPYKRFEETPLRVFLTSETETLISLVSFLEAEFDVKTNPEALSGLVEQVVFGQPSHQGNLEFVPLNGQYDFQILSYMNHPSDSVGSLKLVLGGNSFGFMGTDSAGRDLALGLLFGFPIALIIGLTTSVFATVIGSTLGIISGFKGNKTDIIIQRFSDIWSNVPLLPILIFLIFILGQKLWIVVIIMILFGWPGLTIVVRSMVLQIRTGQLVESTKALGASNSRIMFRHILFQIAPFVLAQMIFFTPAAILAEAGLSFLGLGDPSIPTWGQILESGFRTGAVYLGYWWWIMPPGVLIVITAMAFVLIALALEPAINPKLRVEK
ncbi:MAG: peptide/nickel transport system permease protein [Chloroflexi bacterium]|jgi:peptide/nickel transport system permease protein|nr:MAG: peptide/nickel transport system permease protein [Chloroflexota bacterium]